MHEGYYQTAREQAHEGLDRMLDEGANVCRALEGFEVRVEQRVTVEAGPAHAKWVNKVEHYIGDDADEDHDEA